MGTSVMCNPLQLHTVRKRIFLHAHGQIWLWDMLKFIGLKKKENIIRKKKIYRINSWRWVVSGADFY